MFSKGHVIKSKYQIVKKIGKGATAEVYLAEDLLNNKKVALKISKNDAKVTNNDKRFMQEARLLIKFNDKHIVDGYEVFESDDKVVIAMEYIDGESLDVRLKKENKFTSDDTVNYILQVLRALKALHKEGIMHRDLKPSNLLISKTGNIKLMDFGIAQVSEDQGFTKQGNIIGTIGYMAPEVIRGAKANPLSEIYSLGAMAYKMLAGSLPFGKGRDIEVARKIVAGGANPVHIVNTKVDEILSGIVMKMMRLEAELRYQSLQEIEEEIIKYKNGELRPVKSGWKIFKRK